MSETIQKHNRSYFYPEGITPDLYRLDGDQIPARQWEQAMGELQSYIATYRKSFLGFQSTAQLDIKHLARYMDTFMGSALNNIGDAFADPKLTDPDSLSQLADGYFSLNSKWIERAVLDYFAERWHAGAPRRVKEDGDDDSTNWEQTYWGYVLSMGSTEGNLMALRSARDYLKGRVLLYESNAQDANSWLRYEESDNRQKSEFNPVLLYSTASHYSVRKLAQMLEIDSYAVRIDAHGRMDLDELLAVARYVLHQERRPLAVLFNYGTTWTGALDDVETAVARLIPELKKAGMFEREVRHATHSCIRRGFWFHVDGALGAGYGTYVREHDGNRLPIFDFRNDIQSIVMSGHKWIGAQWPTGVFMTQNRYMLTNDVPSYVGSLDSTLAGSRSGIAPIFLWDWIARRSDQEREREALTQLNLARYAQERIIEEWDSEAACAPGSIMVVFKKPSSEALIRKYALSASGDQVHLVCMRHVDEALIDKLIADLKKLKETTFASQESMQPVDDMPREGW